MLVDLPAGPIAVAAVPRSQFPLGDPNSQSAAGVRVSMADLEGRTS